MSERVLDVVVLGGGIMGSTTALHLAEAGMRVAVLDRRGLCSAASGVNAGTLSLLNKRVGLIPYALRSLDLWETMAERSGVEVGYRRIGGLSIAFTEEEAEAMRTHMEEKRQAGSAHRDRRCGSRSRARAVTLFTRRYGELLPFRWLR